MSKGGKIALAILCVFVSIALVLGITFSVQNTETLEDENVAYAIKLEDLEKELNYHVENVSKLEAEIELNGLTIEDLTKTIVVYETEIIKLENTIVEKEVQIVEKENTIIEKEVEIVELKTDIVEKNAEVKAAENKVIEYRDRIVVLESESVVDQEAIASLRAEIDNLNARITELNADIAELNATLAEQEQQIIDLEAQIATLETEKSEAQAEVVAKEAVISEKETVIEQKETEIQELVVNVNVLNETIVELNVEINLLQEEIANSKGELNVETPLTKRIFEATNHILVSSTNYNTTGLYLYNTETCNFKVLTNVGYNWTGFIKITDAEYVISGQAGSCNGLWLLDLQAETLTQLYKNNQGPYNNSYQLKNGNYLITGEGGLPCVFLYDVEAKTATNLISNNGGSCWVELASGDVVMTGTTVLGEYYYDFEAMTMTKLSSSYRNFIKAFECPNGDVLFLTEQSYVPGVYKLTRETMEISQIYTEGYNWISFTEKDDATGVYIASSDETTLFYNYETLEIGISEHEVAVEGEYYTIIDMSDEGVTIENQRISKDLANQEVSLSGSFPTGNYLQGIEVMTLDESGDEVWTLVDKISSANNGNTIGTIRFVLDPSWANENDEITFRLVLMQI